MYGLRDIPNVAPNAIDYNGPWATAWYCNGSFLSSLIPACTPPSVGQIVADTSGYGKNLSPESRQAATDMAIAAVDADMATNPCNYAAIDPTAAARCNPVSNYLPWIIGGIAAILLLRRV